MCRRAHASRATIFFLQHGFDGLGWKSSKPHLHQRADDAPAHAIKKTFALDDESVELSALLDGATRQSPRGGARLVIGLGGEGLKVVFAGKGFGGGAHLFQVQFARDVPRRLLQQRIHRVMIPDVIAILLAAGMETRVKIFGCPDGGQHADVVRQPGVEGDGQPASGQFIFAARNFKVRHHAQRVNARVRAAGTVQARGAGEKFCQRGFDFFLHAQTDLLQLPALVGRAIVGDGEFEFDRVHA